MLAYVLNEHGKPLMPCHPAKARILLKQGKARVVGRKPFVIQLVYGSSGYKQPITLGVDSGYGHVGLSACTTKKEILNAELELRSNIVELNSQRREYRRTRRNRKTWYRQPRFLNRKKKEGWLAPSVQHKIATHLRIIEKIAQILPVSQIVVEVAAFDIQKIKNPEISGIEYQHGEQAGFWNTREYVLHRDGHTCRNCKGKSKDVVLEVHHLQSRQTGGDHPENLITLCSKCHQKVSKGKLKLKISPSKGFKSETFMTSVRWQLVNLLKASGYAVKHSYGYITKHLRISAGIPKSHANDAFIIAGGNQQPRESAWKVWQNRRNNRGIQTNRKGYAPAIRKRRYQYQPGDLVKAKHDCFCVKGVFNYGTWVRLIAGSGQLLNMAISKTQLLKYQRGIIFGL